MYVIEKMRLNKLVIRPIVSNKELFLANQGKINTGIIDSKDTSDCVGTPTPEGASKTKILGLAQEICDRAYLNRETNGNVSELNSNAKDV